MCEEMNTSAELGVGGGDVQEGSVGIRLEMWA